ncbi:pilus assembly protein [bacterium]|nr:pilus assembly protein [bacterium]
MKKLICSQKGQSFVELVLVMFLFTMFIMGIMQLVMIGSAQLKCEMAARRAAWLESDFNHTKWEKQKKELRGIFPEHNPDNNPHSTGRREKGRIKTVTYTVPAIGFFRIAKPDGFEVSATNAVIAYNEAPIASKGLQVITDWAKKQLGI